MTQEMSKAAQPVIPEGFRPLTTEEDRKIRNSALMLKFHMEQQRRIEAEEKALALEKGNAVEAVKKSTAEVNEFRKKLGIMGPNDLKQVEGEFYVRVGKGDPAGDHEPAASVRVSVEHPGG